MIFVPQNAGWSEMIEREFGAQAHRETRYAFKKDTSGMDRARLAQAAKTLPEGYVMQPMNEPLYHACQKNGCACDQVSQFPDYAAYAKGALGYVITYQGEMVSGASTYARSLRGIEIQIDTREDHRRRGLAYACAAALVAACLDNGLMPSWDAQNRASMALAKKLGFRFAHEYTAYTISRA